MYYSILHANNTPSINTIRNIEIHNVVNILTNKYRSSYTYTYRGGNGVVAVLINA